MFTRLLTLMALLLSAPALAAGFTLSLGARLASEPSADLRLGYEAELAPGMAMGFNSRLRLRGLPIANSNETFPRNRYLSGDAQISPFVQFTQRIQLEGVRLEPYQLLELTAGSYLISQNPSGAYVSLTLDLGLKQRFPLDRSSRLSNDTRLGLERWSLLPGEFIGNAFYVFDELRLDWNLGFIEPYGRGSVALYPLAGNLVFGFNAGANFNFSPDLEGQLEVGFKTNESPYLQTRLIYRIP